MIKFAASFLLISLLWQGAALAQDFRALGRLDTAKSQITVDDNSAEIELAISQSIPFRISALNEPRRLIIDFNELDFTGVVPTDIGGTPENLRFGAFAAGWTRLILNLPAPMALKTADMRVNAASGEAIIRLELTKSSDTAFAEWAMNSQTNLRQLPKIAHFAAKPRRVTEDRPLVVVIDPGHGGIDSGAEREGVREAELVLTFAKELQSLLSSEGGMEVHLTRRRDIFVPLQSRVSFARKMQADVFLSIHADALEKGRATGTSIYTLSDEASDEASQLLAETQDRVDLLAGVDLSGQDDSVTEVLMDMVRQETEPRTEMLADSLLSGIRTSLGSMHRRPHLKAGFAVLRAPDIPSVLIELGFMSSADDLAQMRDPGWRDQISFGILMALQSWASSDAAATALKRK